MSYDCCDPILPAPDWTMWGSDVTALFDTSTGPIPDLVPTTGDITPLMDVISEMGRQDSILLGHDPALDFSSGDADLDGIVDSVDPYNVSYDPYDAFDA